MVTQPEDKPDSPSRTDGRTWRKLGGVLPGAEGQAAFELVRPRPSAIPVLISVPHAGRVYPDDLLQRMRAPGDSCLRLEDRLVDMVARQVAQDTGAALLVAHAPRAMIDLNRATEDMDWDMLSEGRPRGMARFAAGRRARSGLGLVPRRLPGLGELWCQRMSGQDLAARIEMVHRPYHATLSQVLDSLADKWGAALLLDLHSMPPLGPKTGHDAAPDFVIGDRYGSSCGAGLSLSAIAHIEAQGRRVAHNRPYAGGYVLDRHAAPARGLHAMQVEICRAAYLDEALVDPGEGMADIARILSGLVRRLGAEVLSGQPPLAQAAE